MSCILQIKHRFKMRYICFEGTDGSGKTTQCTKLVQYLTDKGHKVLHTKEPGTPHLPSTMALRALMLDNRWNTDWVAFKAALGEFMSNAEYLNDCTPMVHTTLDYICTNATSFEPWVMEHLSQCIRSIHIAQLIQPTRDEGKIDYIIQDRGILSGLAYGMARMNDLHMLQQLTARSCDAAHINDIYKVYDLVVYLDGNVDVNLKRATTCKSEFKDGDAIEALGTTFQATVQQYMTDYLPSFPHVLIPTDSIDKVHSKILAELGV